MTDAWHDTLFAGERLLWTGRPDGGLFLRPIEWLLIPFSLLWGGFMVFWNITAWTADAPTEFTLFGVPFLVVGVYVVAGRFLHDMWLRRRTRYAVTDQRILIRRQGLGGSMRSLDIRNLPMLDLRETAAGPGTIQFETESLFSGRSGFGIWTPALSASARFLRIADARAVYAIIRGQRG
ncbi:PH domain-containing protein [Sphingomonas sp. Leaf17]|uniref:PH domain-containing protein n=1 Tax=Sphingomonas sp. Leaf17 TaxID=1735683 RepID=UPI0012E1E06B|nr:PH domain-containing protein [Sphingomonas sp. Leaf17]